MGSATPGNGTVPAIQQAAAMANNGVVVGTNKCLEFVRTVLGFSSDPVSPENGAVSAQAAWDQVPLVARQTNTTPPPGVPVYWTGGSSGYGHIALSAGNGQVYSTDFGPNGYVGDGRVRLVSINAISAHDHALKYAGWSNDLGATPTSAGGKYGTVYDTPGTGMTTTSGQAPSDSSNASGLSGALSNLFDFLKGGAERVALFVGGFVILMGVLWKLGG